MAAAFFNTMVSPEKACATSAGTDPGARVHAEVVQVMREVGIDLSTSRPRLLSAEVAAGSRFLVTMGCGDQCPVLPGVKVLDWPLEDPKGQPIERVREIREDIRRRIREFVEMNGWGR